MKNKRKDLEELIKNGCINDLHKLIKDIKEDKASDNYSFRRDVLNIDSMKKTANVRYSLIRIEYIDN